MRLAALIWHVAGFLAPALFVAVGLTLLAQAWDRALPPLRVLWRRMAVNFAAGALALLAGLALSGHDGRMLTYAALVLACAATQGWQTRR